MNGNFKDRKHKLENVCNNLKKINGKPYQVWKGIKIMSSNT